MLDFGSFHGGGSLYYKWCLSDFNKVQDRNYLLDH